MVTAFLAESFKQKAQAMLAVHSAGSGVGDGKSRRSIDISSPEHWPVNSIVLTALKTLSPIFHAKGILCSSNRTRKLQRNFSLRDECGNSIGQAVKVSNKEFSIDFIKDGQAATES